MSSWECPECGKKYDSKPSECDCEDLTFVFHEPQYFIVEVKEKHLQEYLYGVAGLQETKTNQLFRITPQLFEKASSFQDVGTGDFYLISEDFGSGEDDEMIINYKRISEVDFEVLKSSLARKE